MATALEYALLSGHVYEKSRLPINYLQGGGKLNAFRVAAGVALLALTTSGCSSTLTWQEEVKLSDGRLIVVTQKRRYEGAYDGSGYSSHIVREAWLTFRLPELGNREIVWHENLSPLTLNLAHGKLYIVAYPPTGREFDLYGRQQPPYVAYRFEPDGWKRIQFAEIPEAIYETNLLMDVVPPKDVSVVSLARKNEIRKDPTIGRIYLRIDPSDKHP